MLWCGNPWRLLRLAEAGEVEVCIAPAMLVELSEVLSYERLRPRQEQLGLSPAQLIAYVVDLVSVFEVPEESSPLVIADPDDDVFLRCAVVAEADYVISGDHHLLDIGTHAHMPILTVRDFLAQEFPDHLD